MSRHLIAYFKTQYIVKFKWIANNLPEWWDIYELRRKVELHLPFSDGVKINSVAILSCPLNYSKHLHKFFTFKVYRQSIKIDHDCNKNFFVNYLEKLFLIVRGSLNFRVSTKNVVFRPRNICWLFVICLYCYTTQLLLRTLNTRHSHFHSRCYSNVYLRYLLSQPHKSFRICLSCKLLFLFLTLN